MVHFMLCLFYHNKGEMPTITQVTINPYNIYLFCCSVISHVWLFETPWTAAHQAPLSSPLSQNLLKFMSIDSGMLSDHFILCYCSSVFCIQSSPALGSFLISQLFASGGQSIRASATGFPMSIQGWFLLGLTGWISLLPKGLSRVFSRITIQKRQFIGAQPSLWSDSHICIWLLEKL